MAVIKQARAREVMQHADVFDLSDVKREAALLVENAKREALQIIQAGRDEAARLTSGAAQEGYNRGLEQGLSEGREKGQREGFEHTISALTPRLDGSINLWNEALDRWEAERTSMFLEAKRDVLELALQLAQRVVHRHVAVDPDIVCDQLEQALAFVSRTTSIVVTINPKDRDLLERTMPSVMEKTGRSEHVTLREDESMAPGGCVVRTEGGRVDASIDTLLTRLTESLLPGAAARQPEAPPAPPEPESP